MEKVSTFKRAVNPKVRTHIWVVVHVGETEDWTGGSMCPLCGGSPPPPWKGQTLMRSTQLNCDQQTPPPLPLPTSREAGYLYCWFFSPQPPPRPVTPGKNVHRLFSALMMMIEELIMNSPAAHNEMVLQNYWRGKMIIIIKSWPIVLSCDWWLDFVADLTST